MDAFDFSGIKKGKFPINSAELGLKLGDFFPVNLHFLKDLLLKGTK